MSKFSIYRGENNPVAVAVCDKLEYSGSWMGDCFLTVTVKSAEPVLFEIGDYIDYRGERFVLNNIPTVNKKARSGSYGEGFTYENIKFSARQTELTDVLFLDYVLGDNQLHYTALRDFAFFAHDIDDLCDRLQANTNRWCESNGFELLDYWRFITPSKDRTVQRLGMLRKENGVWVGLDTATATQIWTETYGGSFDVDEEKKDVNVQISNTDVWNSLKIIKEQFGLNFISRGRSVIIGSAGIPTNHIFEYGKDNGLYEIEKTADSEQQVITKLFAYGSEKNMPVRYYANLNIRCYGEIEHFVIEGGFTYIMLNVPFERAASFFTNKGEYGGIKDGYLVNVDDDNSHSCQAVVSSAEKLVESILENTEARYPYLEEYTDDKYSAFTYYGSPQEYGAMPLDGTVFFNEGINKDKWISTMRIVPTNLPNNMAVGYLMLPGFPLKSLYQWVKEHDGTNTDDATGRATWKGYTAYFSKDQYQPYIVSLNADTLGIRETARKFDGSDEEEVYPTIENTDKDSLYSAEMMSDNGVFTDGDKTPTVDMVLKFTTSDLNLKELAATGTQDGGTPTITMKDGYCGSMDFKFSADNISRDNNRWKIRCERYHNELLGIFFPYSYSVSQGGEPSADEAYQLRGDVTLGAGNGDKFVITGIPMPDYYISMASEKLLEKALIALSKNDYTRFTYQPKVDELYMVRQHNDATASHTRSLYMTLKEGDIMLFADGDLGVADGRVFIDTLTIHEDGNNGIPTYEVTLRNDKSVGTIQRLQEKVDSLVVGTTVSGNGNTSGVSAAQIRPMIETYGEQIFLSKTKKDSAAEEIGFLKGLWVKTKGLFGIAADGAAKVYSLLVNGLWGIDSNGDVTARNMTAAQLIASILKTPGFVEAVGMIGKGFGVTIDANGKAKVQTDDLIVLGRMIVNSLNIREVTYIGGTYLLTPAGSTIANVQNLYGSSASDTRTWTTSGSGTVVGYRLLWKADDGTTGTMNYWHQGDQAFCQTYNVTEAGEYEDASNRRYWRLVCRVGQTTESGVVWHYADLANVYTAFLYDKNGNPVYNEGGGTGFVGYENANGDEPAAGDKVVCLGSQSDTTRQGAVQMTAEGTASIGIYDNINNYAALSTHEIHYFSKEDVRMNARRFKWTTASGDSVPPTVYHGTWAQGKVSAWGDEWTYNGSNWICVYKGTSPLNITEAPGTTAAYWVENKGQKGDPGDSITKVSETAYYIKNTTGVRPSENDPNWSEIKPTLNKGEWLFTKTIITWSDGSTTVLYTDERNPNDGVNGQDVIVDGATVMEYAVSDNNITQPTQWHPYSEIVSQIVPGTWLWSRATTYYRKASSAAGSHDAGSSVNYSVNYNGVNGINGRAVKSITEYYKATNSSQPMAKPASTTGWDDDPNLSHLTDKWDADHKYLWNMEKVEYTESNGSTTTEYTIPQILAIWTKDGAAGRGIDSIVNYYKVTDSATAPLKPSTPGTSGWSTTPLAPGQGEYLWNYEIITWVNGTPATTETDVQMIGYAGTDGASITKQSEVAYYIKNTTGVRPAADDPSWSTTKPALSEGEWLFTKTVITWSDGSTTLLFTDERNPNDGQRGQDIVVDGSTEVKYYVGSSNTTHPAESSSEWKDLSQVVQTQGMWLWSKSTTYFKKSNSSAGSHDAGKSVVYNVSYIAEDGGLGRGIVSVTEFYKANNSTTAPAVDDSQWDTDPNLSHQTDKWDANHKYLWNYERVEYSSGTRYERTTPQIVAIFTEDGDNGRGIDSITNYYCVTNSNVAPPRRGESGAPTWYSTPQIPGQGQYLWNYEVITWINPSGTTMTEVQMIGYAGENGTTPVKGVDYFDGNDAYSINVTPASIILNQNLNDASDYGLPRTFTISVVAGSTAKTFKVNAPSGTGLTVSRDNSYSRTEHVITLSGVSSSVSSSEISVTLTDIEGMTGTKTIKIPVFVNQLGSWTQTIENGVSTEVGRQIEYGLQDGGVIKTSYDAAITKSAQGLTQEFTEEISKALGTGERNLFGFHKGCKMETSNWFCVPFIQGYGVIINTSVNSYRRGRISNLGLEGQGGYFVVTFQIKLSSGSGAVNVNVCDVEATKGKGSISASAANTNISVNTSWQSYELHFYLADNTPYMDAESYNGFIDFEAQYSSNYDDIYVRHLKIERGDEATEFVEADEDISYTGRAQLLGPLTLKSGVSTGITYTDSKNVSKTCSRYYYSGSSSSTPEWDEVISAKVTQDLVAGRVYTLSYWATSYNSYSNVPKIHNTFSLLNGAVIITNIGSERYDEGAGGISEGVSDDGLTLITLKHREWVRYFVRFYVTNTVSVSDIRRLVALTIYKNYNSSWYGYIYMTDIVLQEGYAMEPTRYSSLMEQSARRISLGVSDGLSRTGIDIEAGKIKAVADQFEWQNQDGEQLMGLDSNGDATFKGTIKSKNFYHGVVIYTEENSYWCKKADGGYGFVVGKYYTREQVAAMSNNVYGTPPDSGNDIFFNCIGSADFVVIKRTANDTGDIYISLPVVSDFEGKVIEIVDTRYTQPSGTSYVGALIVMQVDGAWKLKHSFTEQYGTDAIQLNGNQDHEGGVYRLLAYNGFWVRLD